MSRAARWAPFAVAAAALLFSTGGAAIKGTTLAAWQVAGLRSAVAAVALIVLVPESRRGWNWRVPVVGVAYALTLITFVHANKLTTSANAIFLQSTAPAYLLVIGPFVLRERITRADIVFTAALAAGMALLLHGADGAVRTAPDPARGNLWAAASGLCYAVTLAGLRWQAHKAGGGAAIATVVAGNVLAFLLSAPNMLPLAGVTAADGLVIGYLGVFQIALAYWFLTRGIRHVTAFESSVLLLLEPVCNPVWTWLLHGERPGAWALAGGAVIIASTLWKNWGRTGRFPNS